MKLIPTAAAEKRAKNMVWAAAGEYGFSPEFLAYDADGEPDPYMNCVVGLACRQFTPAGLAELFAPYAADLRREALHQILWLGLENYAYERELSRRPVLAELREEYAREALAQEKNRTEVRWTEWGALPHNLQNARLRRILGEDYRLPSPREEALSRRLALSGDLTPEAAAAELRAILAEAVKDPGRRPSALRRGAGRALDRLGRLFGKREVSLHERFRLPSPPPEDGAEPRAPKRRREVRYVRDAAETRREIQGAFGRSALPEGALREMERALCTGNHAQCRLWVTRGEGCAPPEAISQYWKSNRDYFETNRPAIDSQVRALTARLLGTVQPRRVRTPIPSRTGRLEAGNVWRARCFPDPALFQRREPDIASDFSVTLLLDGSESRTDRSAAVAAQGYIVAESLRRCRIPVQVLSFCSVKGCTVLQILKPYGARSCRGVLRYSAVGMNRDGLALRAAGYLLDRAAYPGRILLVLTDAMPKDNTPVPTLHPLIQASYENDLAVRDTAGEVRRLRERDIRVGAVFMGLPRYARDAALLYGGELVVIHEVSGFPAAVGTLLEKQILTVQ